MQDRILEIAKVILGEGDVERVLTRGLDGLIELCGAERGMILLFDADGELLYEKARNLDRQDLQDPEFKTSRSIIRQVRRDGQAFFDENLADQPTGVYGDSVYRLGLMSVICLPLRNDEGVFGVVYLDSRNPRTAFGEETVAAVEAFSEIISAAAENALEKRRLRTQVDCLEVELRKRYHFEKIIGRDPAMLRVLRLVSQVASSDATVLIEGESGTGKDLIARAIHFNSRRRDQAFLPVNCGALAENLQEAELFGHERGAFTGAIRTSPGWFERADGGTLFLDEVGEMSLALQVKFLRVLESGEYSRVGSTTIRKADVRIVAATNRDLEELVKEGKMRSDLLWRLAVIKVRVPPLRERRGDILLLAEHFLASQEEPSPGEPWRLSKEAEAALMAYPFQGNVRELQNVLQRAVLVAEGPVIGLDDLPETLPGGGNGQPTPPRREGFKEAKRRVVEDFERGYLSRCLEEAAGNITRASSLAGIDVKNFHTKMKGYGIDARAFKKG